LYDLYRDRLDTLSRAVVEFRNFAMTDDGSRIAYVAEKRLFPGANENKVLQKFYSLYYFEVGMDSATVLADKNSVGMRLGMTVSESAPLSFSKKGTRLFFGVSPIKAPRDTSLVDIDLVKLDIWHYKDDYLQTVQLKKLQEDLKQSFLAVYDFDLNMIHPLGSQEIPQILQTDGGDGSMFVGVTDYGKRIESQWTGNTKKDVYAIDPATGEEKMVKENLYGSVYASSAGKYILWFDRVSKNYFTWDGEKIRNITQKINVPLYDEDNDLPDEPLPYGIMGWQENDSLLFVYDRYDIWEVDPAGNKAPAIFESEQHFRTKKIRIRYIRTDPDKDFISGGDSLLFRLFDETSKK
jgi:hypothetical protein